MATKTAKTTARPLHVLTARQVGNATDEDLDDGGGLVLRVAGERASWVLRYTSPAGKRREMGLGVAHRDTLAQAGDSLTTARTAARDARDLLAKGLDPLDVREQQRLAAKAAEAARKAETAKQQLTLARAARDYHERVIEPTRTAKHAAQWISSLENHLPADLWHAPVAEVTPQQLLAALTKIGHHERARNVRGGKPLETISRIRQRLDAVFEDCIFHEHCTANPAAAVRRKMGEQLPAQDNGNFAALPYREAPAVMQRLRDMPGTAARCLEFAVLTTARTSEALGAQWQEIDLQAGVWTIPASRMKAKEGHVVYLSPRAVEIVKGQIGQDSVIVFPSPAKGYTDKPMSNMSMLVLLKRMGLRDRTTVHGLCRATFSTWANETAAARPDVIEACLAHDEGNKVRAAYNRAQFNDERAALLRAWSDFLARPAVPMLVAVPAA